MVSLWFKVRVCIDKEDRKGGGGWCVWGGGGGGLSSVSPHALNYSVFK